MTRASAALAAAAALLAGAAPARAATAPCVAGSSVVCHAWSGTVTSVADGDTLDVDLAGDGTRRPRRVRITGINTTELRRYSSVASRRRGECHSREATARLERLVRLGRGRVRLTARDPASRTGGRLRRSVGVRIRGRWRDVGRVLVAEGHALWLPNGVEWAPNAAYSTLAQRARAAGRRLWDPEACRIGPGAADALTLSVRYDAEGDDGRNVNGEWIDVANRSEQPLPLAGWWLRDSAARRFAFPPGAELPPGGTVRLRVGPGEDSATTFHWGLPSPVFENPVADGRAIGDGAYLFDLDGDLRASAIYPCRVACAP